jgi:hypothetical protein
VSNILDIAARVHDLASKADAVLAEYNGQTWGVPDEARAIATAWNDYVIHTKHGPGEIARLAAFVQRVDEVTASFRASFVRAEAYWQGANADFHGSLQFDNIAKETPDAR